MSSCSSSEVLFRLPPLVLPRAALVPRGLPPRFLLLALDLPPFGSVWRALGSIAGRTVMVPRAIGLPPLLAPLPLRPPVLGPEVRLGTMASVERKFELSGALICAKTASRAASHCGCDSLMVFSLSALTRARISSVCGGGLG